MSVKWAYIFHAPGTDPVADRTVLDRDGLVSILVPVPNFDVVTKVANDLIDEGVVSIELCGYFGLVRAGQVIESLNGRAPVGAVTFGSESASLLAKAFQIPE